MTAASFCFSVYLVTSVPRVRPGFGGQIKYEVDTSVLWRQRRFKMGWLAAYTAFGEKPLQRWIGVQWEVTRAAAASRAREIARAVQATWVTGMQDARYTGW